MPLSPPKLDDRTFDQLVIEANKVIDRLAPDWTDRSVSDPGMVLVDVFAYLTEVMLYRLNQLPASAYIEFLRLVGVTLRPPSAAMVRLRFTREKEGGGVTIPRGTRITLARSGTSSAPVFTTSEPLELAPGTAAGDVVAYHCDHVDAELAGVGSGLPGLRVRAKRPPIVAPTGDDLDLVVGVQIEDAEAPDRASIRAYEGKRYRVWREVPSFAETGGDPYVYITDRLAGTITFASAVHARRPDNTLAETAGTLGAIPDSGAEIRLWYRRGGGAAGNVVANSLTVLKDAIPLVKVTNPAPAVGGRDAESDENAMLRGPQELHSLERAVTARDFERVAANSSGAIERAIALTSADLWRHARPGTVEVLMVPSIPIEARRAGVTEAVLAEYQTDEALHRAQHALDERRPLGTKVVAAWARCKPIRVEAHVVIRRGEDPARVHERIIDRLHQTLTPLPSPRRVTGWHFGDPLRIGHIYDLLLADPAVRYADDVRLVVDRVPERDVNSVATDAYQPRTFYAAAGDSFFRTTDSGEGWETSGRFPGENASMIESHPAAPGLVTAISVARDRKSSVVRISTDCGETWRESVNIAHGVDDIEWTRRDGSPVLLLATIKGLYELSMQEGATAVQVLVDSANQDLGFWSVAASVGALGATSVAVAARNTGGIYLSNENGRPGTFRPIGLSGEDIRVLATQSEGPNAFLWAGVAAPGAVGKGCHRWRIWETPEGGGEWVPFSEGWDGGSCQSLAFYGSVVHAATQRAGVATLDTSVPNARWSTSEVSSNLPIQELTRFEPVYAVAVDPSGHWLLAAGPRGVYRSVDGGTTFQPCSSPAFTDKVTIPSTWLFCTAEHQIDIVVEGEQNG
ncbi:MAG: baseplate J/gp47 family protein [Thermoanaerobaculia bacterium]